MKTRLVSIFLCTVLVLSASCAQSTQESPVTGSAAETSDITAAQTTPASSTYDIPDETTAEAAEITETTVTTVTTPKVTTSTAAEETTAATETTAVSAAETSQTTVYETTAAETTPKETAAVTTAAPITEAPIVKSDDEASYKPFSQYGAVSDSDDEYSVDYDSGYGGDIMIEEGEDGAVYEDYAPGDYADETVFPSLTTAAATMAEPPEAIVNAGAVDGGAADEAADYEFDVAAEAMFDEDYAGDGAIARYYQYRYDEHFKPQAGTLTAGEIRDTADLGNFKEYVKNAQSIFDFPSDMLYETPLEHTGNNSLELMFTIDTTGSMGDELSYIQTELEDVIKRVVRDNKDLPVRLSVNFYRDKQDTYVTKSYPFTSHVDWALKALAKQNASGGGDNPEAVHCALNESVNYHQWGGIDTTKLMFMVLDAPPHAETSIAEQIKSSVKAAAQKGIRIIPIIASGADTDTERLMREIAVATGGTYIFLTDDSGVGGEHTTPTDTQYTVKALNDLLVDVINRYLKENGE
jgi:hypothetical protein